MEKTGTDLLLDQIEVAVGHLDRAEYSLMAFQAILDQLPLIFVVGNLGRWLVVSEAFAEALGYTREELEPMDWRDLVLDTDPLDPELERSRQGDGTAAATVTYRKRDGGSATVQWSWAPAGVGGEIGVGIGQLL